MKIYAVKVGLSPGLYTTWKECEKQVKGFPGALYKSFFFRRRSKQISFDT